MMTARLNCAFQYEMMQLWEIGLDMGHFYSDTGTINLLMVGF